jgi:hypothetical protein
MRLLLLFAVIAAFSSFLLATKGMSEDGRWGLLVRRHGWRRWLNAMDDAPTIQVTHTHRERERDREK